MLLMVMYSVYTIQPAVVVTELRRGRTELNLDDSSVIILLDHPVPLV